jgi:hypothetical protein
MRTGCLASFNPAGRVFSLSLRHTDNDLADRLAVLEVLEVPDMPDVLPVLDNTRHTAVKTRSTRVDSQETPSAVYRLPSAICHLPSAVCHYHDPCHATPCQPRRRRRFRPIRHAPSPPPIVSEADARSW